MPQEIVLQLARPITAVQLIHGPLDEQDGLRADPMPMVPAEESDADRHEANRQLEERKTAYVNAVEALQSAVDRLNHLSDEIFAGHNEAIARLSIEIARKVLMQKVSDGDYEIESIIRETLKHAPDQTALMIRVNPQDLSDLQALQEKENSILNGIRLTADPGIGRAECVVESAKGIVKLLIAEHLEQISQALIKTANL